MTFSDILDFDDYTNDEQDVALVADNHLFENGPDLFDNALGQPLAPGSNPVQETTDVPQQTFDFPPQETFDVPQQTFDFPPQQTFDVPQQTFDFPQNNGLHTPGFSNTGPVDPKLWNIDPGLVNIDTDIILTPTTAPETSAVNPAAVHDDSYSYACYSGVTDSLFPELLTTEEQQQWEKDAIESMQPFFESQSELQPDARVEDWLINQNQVELGSQQTQGPQAQYNVIPDATTQLPQITEPVDVHQPTQPDSPIEYASSPEVPLPSKSRTKPRTKRDTRRTQTPAKRDAGLTTSGDAISGLSFSSLHDAEIAMTSRHMEYDWESPSPDDSIPNTKLERSRYVRDILTAFQDTSECKENKNGSSFLKRWMSAGYYNVQDIEKVCWYIVSVAERVHSEGPSALKIYCAEAQRKIYPSRHLTFSQRIEAICDCLKYSKSICDNLMKAEGIETLVGAPKLRMNAARAMLPQNAKRQQWMTQGRNEDPTHVSNRPGRGSVAVQAPVQVKGAEVEGAAPLKRKRKAKQPKQPKGAAESQPGPTAAAQTGTSLDASLSNPTPSQPTAPTDGYAPAQAHAPPQVTVPPQSPASINEPAALLRELSEGPQSSFEESPTTPAPLPLKPVRSNPDPLWDALTKDVAAQPSASEPSRPVRKPRVKVKKELLALLADAEHSKAVAEAHALSKRGTKASANKAPKTKESLKSVDDGSDSESEAPARPTKRQRKPAPAKKPEFDIARRRRLSKEARTKLWDVYTSLDSRLKSGNGGSSDDDTPVSPKSTPPVSKKRKAIPDADSEDEVKAPRRAKRTKSSKVVIEISDDEPEPVKKEPVKKGTALRKKAASTTKNARKPAPAKRAPAKGRKAMRKIPATEDSDDSQDEYVPDSDDGSASDSDSGSDTDSGSDCDAESDYDSDE